MDGSVAANSPSRLANSLMEMDEGGMVHSDSSAWLDAQVRKATSTDSARLQQPIADLKAGTLRTLADALLDHFTFENATEHYDINNVQGYLLAHPWFFKTPSLIEQVTRPLWEKRMSLSSGSRPSASGSLGSSNDSDSGTGDTNGVPEDVDDAVSAENASVASNQSSSAAGHGTVPLVEASIRLMCYWRVVAPCQFVGEDEKEIVARLCDLCPPFGKRFKATEDQQCPRSLFPEPSRSPVESERKSIALHMMGPEHLAEHIAYLDHQHFSSVPVAEMLYYARKGGSSSQATPELQKAINFFNGCTQYVTSMVLQGQNSVTRAKAFSRFVHVAKALRRLRCYDCLMAAVGALKYGSSITRLTQTMALIPQQDMKDLDELAELLQADGNYVAMRKEVQSEPGKFVLPVIGIVLKDFVAVNNAMPNKVGEEPDRVFNFAKLLHFGLLIYNLRVVQKKPPSVSCDEELLKILQLSFQPHYTEKELYDLSLDREPRTKQDKEGPTEIPFQVWTQSNSLQVDRTTMDSYIESMVDAVFKRYDVDKSGSISLEEFESIRSNFLFMENFQVLDANQDGVLSREEMLAYFKKVNFMRALRESFVHDFVETTYLSPTFCAHCKGLLWGLVKQGLKCKNCNINCHRNCQDRIVIDCHETKPDTKTLTKKPTASKGNRSSRPIVSRRSTIQIVCDLEDGLSTGEITQSEVKTRMHDLYEENERLKTRVNELQRRLDQRESQIGMVRQRTIAFVLEHLDNLNASRESNV